MSATSSFEINPSFLILSIAASIWFISPPAATTVSIPASNDSLNAPFLNRSAPSKFASLAPNAAPFDESINLLKEKVPISLSSSSLIANAEFCPKNLPSVRRSMVSLTLFCPVGLSISSLMAAF